MNVKEAIELIYKPDDAPVYITIGYEPDFRTEINIYNAFHMEAYGRFKVAYIRALEDDSYYLDIATTPCRPIIEDKT